MLEEPRFDSSGVFTVDWLKLRKNYQGLLKVEPDLYLCKIFQAAVAARATRLDIRTSRQHLVFHWNTHTSLLELQNQLLTGQGHLATGLQLASTRPDLKITIHSGEHCLVWHRGQASLEKHRHEGTSLQISSSRWRPLVSLKWPEFAHFRARLGYHPLQMRINGRSIGVGNPGTLATHARFQAKPEAGAVGLNLVDTPAVYSFEGDKTGRCVQYINLNSNGGVSNPYSLQTHFSDDVLIFVQDGLPVYRSNNWLGKVGVFMAVADNRLPTDASTLNLVRGPELQAAIGRAREGAEQFLFELEERFPGEANPHLAAALRAIRFLPR